MTYTQLKADIADYLHRTDLTDKIPLFIRLAEASLFREIHPPEMETKATGVTVGELVTLPADFGALVKLTTTLGGTERSLEYITLPDVSAGGLPGEYSYDGGAIRIYGASDQAYTIYYSATIPALSDTVASNWLLENGYDVYLYASALEGAKYIRDSEQVSALFNLTSQSVAAIKSKMKMQHLPASGSLRIRAR